MLFPHTITNIRDYKLWLGSQIKAGVLEVVDALNVLADMPDAEPNNSDNFHARRQGAVRVAVRAIRRQREMERVYSPLGIDVRTNKGEVH